MRIMTELQNMAALLRDALYLLLPYQLTRSTEYRFAFLVHPRSRRDLFRKVPLLRYTPESVVSWFEYHWTPAIVSPITGLTDSDGKSIEGYVIGIPMSPEAMLNNREQALVQIRHGVQLARAHGARIIGLGALTSSLSKGGLDLTDIPDIAITTGHAFTGYTVSQTLLTLMARANVSPQEAPTAIVGAAGSIGTISAHLLARAGVRHFLFIDVARKRTKVDELMNDLHRHYPDCTARYSEDIASLKKYAFVVTATNTPEALVKTEHVSPGTVIVDDAQPSDIEDALWKSNEVLVASAGAVFTPGISSNFPMGLAGREDNYCCLAEVLALAHEKKDEHFVLNRPTLDMVDTVVAIAEKLHFRVADIQGPRGYIPTEKIDAVLKEAKKRCTV